LSFDLYRRLFGDTPGAVVGRTLTIENHPYSIAGIMPRGFSGAEPDAPDFWILAQQVGLNSNWRVQRTGYKFAVVARLRREARSSDVEARIAALHRSGSILASGVGVRLLSIIPGRARIPGLGDLRLSLAI